MLDDFAAASRSVEGQSTSVDSMPPEVLVRVDEVLDELGRELAGDRPAPESGSANASGHAAHLLFEIVIRHVVAHLGGGPALQQVGQIALALDDVLGRAERTAADSRAGMPPHQVQQLQIEERRRIGRDLHDHIGNGIGVAQRDLELFEVYRLADPERALARVRAARDHLLETMEAVRVTIGMLRLMEPVEDLEKEVRRFLERTAGPALERHVEVNGDEALAPAETVNQTFLIVREALRNAIAHADARKLLVRIDITPDQLRASVVDDGRGFPTVAGRPGGTGVLSMRERAALLGGSLTINSRPGEGTRIDLCVPLVQ